LRKLALDHKNLALELIQYLVRSNKIKNDLLGSLTHTDQLSDLLTVKLELDDTLDTTPIVVMQKTPSHLYTIYCQVLQKVLKQTKSIQVNNKLKSLLSTLRNLASQHVISL
jgi:hypothetical protein